MFPPETPGGSESLRDLIAFPKNNSGHDVMLDAPATIDDKQLEELRIRLEEQKSKFQGFRVF